SNAMNPADLSSSFMAPSTGPGTATVYSAQQMNIGGVASPTTVSVAYDANNALTVTNKGGWNAVKNATVESTANGVVSVNNLVDQSTGKVSLTGGGGSDVFEFFAGAHATVSDFQAGQDSILLHGVSPGQVQVSTSAGSTLIALGGGATIQLAGVALTAQSLNIVYA